MPILYFKEDESSAIALASLSQTRDKPQLFGSPLAKDSLSDITLVAHTSDEATHIGDKTPKELAEDFLKMFARYDKTALQDIYLISCEAGMVKDGKHPLAKQFLDIMHARGFTSLKVHAITNPEGVSIHGMRVEVVLQGGASLAPSGSVRALMYRNPDSRELDDRLTELNKELADRTSMRPAKHIIAEIRTISASKIQDPSLEPFEFLSTLQYKKTMREPNNTFSKTSPTICMSANVAFAIHFLEQEKLKLLLPEKLDEKRLGYLKSSIAKLECDHHALKDVKSIMTAIKEAAKPHADSRAHRALVKLAGNTSSFDREVISPLTTALNAFEQQHLEEASSASDASDDSDDIAVEKPLIEPPKSGLALRGKFSHFKTPVPEKVTPIINQALIKELEAYREERKAEQWDYHYNFLNVVSFVYYILDTLTGSDHFSSKHRDVKLAAVDKLIAKTQNPTGEYEFTSKETKALQESRLGKIVKKFEAIDSKKTSPTPTV